MNVDLLHKKLIGAARANRPGDRVPYAFEQRVMALLALRAANDTLVGWARGLWRAAASCAAVALLLGVWVFFNPATTSGGTDLSQNFENTLLAAVDQSTPSP